MTSPPLETFQSMGVPTSGAPSSARLTDITALWFVKIAAGPPVIVSTLG